MRAVGSSVWFVLPIAACGRIGFDPGSARSSDAVTSSDALAADAAACVGINGQLAVDPLGTPAGSWVKDITVVADATGFALTYLAPDGAPYATTVTVTGTTPQRRASDKKLAAGVYTSASVAWTGTKILTTSVGSGTTLLPFDDSLNQTGTGSTVSSDFAAARPLAFNGSAIGYVYAETGHVFGRPLNSDGSNATGGGTQIIADIEQASDVTLVPAANGFLVTWSNAASTPASVRAELVDPLFNIVAGPTTIAGTGPVAGTAVRAAWASAQGRYLFTWTPSGSGSAVVAQLADASLGLIGGQILVHAGTKPKVGSDGNSFAVVWHDPIVASQIAGVGIDATGQVGTPRTFTGNGGVDVDHELVTLGSTVHVVWMEQGVTGGPLWITPMCTP